MARFRPILAVAALLALSACYNVSSVRIALPGNRAGADCHAACASRGGDHRATMSCMARCPGATAGEDPCGASDIPPAAVCEHSSTVSRWKTYGLVGLGLAALILIL
jgi:hypothetical protein